MAIYLGVRPVGALATVPVAPPVRGAVADAIATELPPSQSVTATDTTASAGLNPQTSNPMPSQVIVESEAASIVYQTIGERTDTEVSQLSDDAARRRRRAYFRAQEALKADRTFVPATDHKA